MTESMKTRHFEKTWMILTKKAEITRDHLIKAVKDITLLQVQLAQNLVDIRFEKGLVKKRNVSNQTEINQA